MTQDKRDQINTTANIIQTVLMGLIVPLIGWLALTSIQHGNDISVLKYEASKGSNFTRSDAEFIIEKVNDHELRLRKVEAK